MNQIFRTSLVWLEDEFEDNDTFFETMGKRLYAQGFVYEEFGEALKRRELEYPTGLRTEAYDIAIPHTDTKYVKEMSISFVRFKKPLMFLHMGEPEIEVDAKFAFVLGVKEPQEQATVLSVLIQLITDEVMMKSLENMESPSEISETLNRFFEVNMPKAKVE